MEISGIEKIKSAHLSGHNKKEFKVIHKELISPITSMTVEKKETYLGELRNFKNNNYIKNFLPRDLSIGWVKLPKQEKLEAHYHPCPSMIIVTKGTGVSFGDSEVSFEEGDIIHIPAWNLHGFLGTGEAGFEGLSIQFQETAIFESELSPETTYFDRESIPHEQRKLLKVTRNSLKTLSSVTVDGYHKNLGLVKNFRDNENLNKIFPINFSAAWVRLERNETLEVHQHQEKSIILITNGDGEAFSDDLTVAIKSGDGIFVPSNALHGFKGGKDGFWGLSMQFSNESLYQNINKPRVNFISPLERLQIINEKRVLELKQQSIFDIPKSSFLANPKLKEILLDCLQVMSDNFQTLMFSRVALSNSQPFRDVFLEHLMDELNHDIDLKKERGNKKIKIWDSVLEASTSWFLYQNYIIDDPKRVIMVSMVLEKCASQFYGHFSSVLSEELSSAHIEQHCDADPYHESLGLNLLDVHLERRLVEFSDFLNKSWDMMILYIARKGEILTQELEVKINS